MPSLVPEHQISTTKWPVFKVSIRTPQSRLLLNTMKTMWANNSFTQNLAPPNKPDNANYVWMRLKHNLTVTSLAACTVSTARPQQECLYTLSPICPSTAALSSCCSHHRNSTIKQSCFGAVLTVLFFPSPFPTLTSVAQSSARTW